VLAEPIITPSIYLLLENPL